MRPRTVALAAAATGMSLALPVGPVEAKGAEGLTITGPGGAESRVFDATRDEVVSLLMATGVIELTMYAAEERPPAITSPPARLGGLGDAVRLAWDFFCCPSGGTDVPIVQLVYPDAPGGPLVYTPGGQRVYGTGLATSSSWDRHDPGLLDLLADVDDR